MKKKDKLSSRMRMKKENFWSTRDSADYVDWKKAKRVVFSKLKPSVKTISLRLPGVDARGIEADRQ